MKLKKLIHVSLVLLAGQISVRADLPVIDPALLLQVKSQIDLAKQQVDQLTAEVKQLGDPASIIPPGVNQLIQSISQTGVGKTWTEIRGIADGVEAMLYDGHGLYKPIGTTITKVDGTQVQRSPEDYKKYDALAEATSNLEAVLKDTENRRREVLDQLKETTALLRDATTVSEIQKHHGVLTAQSATLGAIDREREAAVSRVQAQKIENDSDAAKQAEARKEEEAVHFTDAQKNLGQFLVPDTSPVVIPDPRAP